jgi:alpha-1,2-mannosyltransferase
VRLLSAAVNTVHDCDEVYNYWEPLHFLLHSSGLQTWENSPHFALRSALYLLLHAAAAQPAKLLLGSASGKRLAFQLLRGLLGALCAAAETQLCSAAAQAGGRRLGLLLWAVLLTSSGMFTCSTTLLPSTFTMVAFAFGAALSLRGRWNAAVAVCVAGGLVGWPFAGLAALPLGLAALAGGRAVFVLAVALASAASVLAMSAALDTAFYGRPTLSVWNLVKYNVFSGESSRYGTERPTFYLLNTLLAFNAALLLSLAAPLARSRVAHFTPALSLTCRRRLQQRGCARGASDGACSSCSALCTSGWAACPRLRTRRSASCTSSIHRRVNTQSVDFALSRGRPRSASARRSRSTRSASSATRPCSCA